MNFVQLEFVGLFAVVWVAYWVVRGKTAQNGVLLVASAVFYGWVTPWWLGILLLSGVTDFALAQLMERSPAHRRTWLWLSVFSNLGVLGYFKYAGFFVDNVAAAITALGGEANLPLLRFVLPAGISFYTFQTLSYTIDVYRGTLRARSNLVDYLVFVGFFPQLVAGPIERASRLLPQLEVVRTFDAEVVRRGVGLALWGAAKKLVIADTLAPYVDKVFQLEAPSGPLLWTAVFVFMIQLYADFSGYTDMARGTARMLGIDLVRNFDAPWKAATTQEFWQRWHISLSTWIRDYLLTPLLGTSAVITPARYAGAITVTMVVMGVWHGAGWNFVAFGLWQSAAILFYGWAAGRLPQSLRGSAAGRWAAVAVHTAVVGGLGALLFREPSLERIVGHLTRNPLVASLDEWKAAVGMLGVAMALQWVVGALALAYRHWVRPLRGSVWVWPASTTLWAVTLWVLGMTGATSGADFLYFQF